MTNIYSNIYSFNKKILKKTVKSLKELTYLPKGVMDPHDIPSSDPRVGKLPEEVLDWMKSSESKEEATVVK